MSGFRLVDVLEGRGGRSLAVTSARPSCQYLLPVLATLVLTPVGVGIFLVKHALFLFRTSSTCCSLLPNYFLLGKDFPEGYGPHNDHTQGGVPPATCYSPTDLPMPRPATPWATARASGPVSDLPPSGDHEGPSHPLIPLPLGLQETQRQLFKVGHRGQVAHLWLGGKINSEETQTSYGQFHENQFKNNSKICNCKESLKSFPFKNNCSEN